MTIRPIPLTGLAFIIKVLRTHRGFGADPEHDIAMQEASKLVEQIKHQHDDEPRLARSPEIDICDLIPGAGDMVRHPDGSLAKATKEDRMGLEIVQLREMVKARDEEIAKILNKGEDFVRVSKQDLAELELLGHRCGVKATQRYTDAIKARLDENDRDLAELRAMVKSKSEQIKDMSANIWEWRNVPHHEKVFRLANDLKDAKTAIELRDASIAALREQLRMASNQYAIRLDKIRVLASMP